MKLKSEYIRLDPTQRLYGMNVPVIGLTGGIATGKSTVSRLLTAQGFTVIDADQLVKSIYERDDAIHFIQKNYPDVIRDGKILFPELRKKVFSSNEIKKTIEEFIYLRLPGAFSEAISKVKGCEVIIYDVPLLFEKNLSPRFDLTVLVYAPRAVQLSRLMARDNQTKEMSESIIDQQMDIEEKRKLSDYIISNTSSEGELKREIDQFISRYFI